MGVARQAVPFVGAVMFMFVASAIADAQTVDTAALSLDPSRSTVAFSISAKAVFTFNRNGQFKDFDGVVSYDPSNPASTHIDLTVYTNSVDMHNSGHERLLKSEDFFDVEHFPTMHFASSSAFIRADGTGMMTGAMTIRGITKDLTIPVKVLPDAMVGGAVLETNFQIDRTQFGLNGRPVAGGLNVSIGKNVQIHIAMAVSGSR